MSDDVMYCSPELLKVLKANTIMRDSTWEKLIAADPQGWEEILGDDPNE